MRVPLSAALLVALVALAGAAAASPLDDADLAALAVAAPHPLLAPPGPQASPADAAEAPAAPEFTGPAEIVGRAAALVASGQASAEDLPVLAAQQQLVGALESASAPVWDLERALPELPIPAASVAPPTTLPESISAPARAAVVAVSGASVLAALGARLPMLPLYSRIQREEAMLNGRRNQLYELVRSEPGIHLSDLVRRSGLGWGAALYHLGVLEKNRVLVAHTEGGFKRYFANGAQPREEMPRLIALRHGAAKALFEAVQAFPGRSGRELATSLGLSPSSLARASDRLEDAGLLKRVREGRRMLYFPGDAAAAYAMPAPQPVAA